MNEQKLLIDIQEKPKSVGKWILLSFQHVFAMFGATVLVPLLTGLNIGVALLASGIGTLIYIACTKGKVPVYLGSSFAYIGAIQLAVVSNAKALGVVPQDASLMDGFALAQEAISNGALSFLDAYGAGFLGLMAVGLTYIIVSTIIRFTGSGWLKKLLPPIVVGPMIIIIGLSLASVAVGNIGIGPDGGSWQMIVVAAITFLAAGIISIKAKGFLKIVPFLVAILIGYVAAIIFKQVDYTIYENAQFLQLPDVTIIGSYGFNVNWGIVISFIPLAFVTIAEHIGDHTVLGEITGRDFITDPGLANTLLGDGIATFVAGAIGGPANTTYGENTGVVAVTKVGSVWVIGLAAVIAVLLGFFGWIQAFIQSVPWSVIGGITLILYGLIAANGVKVLIKDRTDLGNMRNLIVVSTMLVIGLGSAVVPLNAYASLTGMSLAVLVGIVLNQALLFLEKLKFGTIVHHHNQDKTKE